MSSKIQEAIAASFDHSNQTAGADVSERANSFALHLACYTRTDYVALVDALCGLTAIEPCTKKATLPVSQEAAPC